MEKKTVQEWRSFIQPALSSKRNEFKLIGYENVTEEEIWNCLEAKVWKGNPVKRLYEVTADVFHLSAGTYMSFVRIGALKMEDDDLQSSIQALIGKDNA